jgi:hypothetical protein
MPFNTNDLIFAPILKEEADGTIKRLMALGLYKGIMADEEDGSALRCHVIYDLSDSKYKFIHAAAGDENNRYGSLREQESCIEVADLNTPAISNFNLFSKIKLGYMINPVNAKIISQPLTRDIIIKIPQLPWGTVPTGTRGRRGGFGRDEAGDGGFGGGGNGLRKRKKSKGRKKKSTRR